MIKDLEYWRKNAEEDYITTPISVLRYISELEKTLKPVVKPTNKEHVCRYSKSMNQPYPRLCIDCKKPENVQITEG